MSNNLKIPLYAQKDKHGRTFYMARLQFPGTLNFKDGVSFIIFNSIEGEEELQIGELYKEGIKS
jgi:hypothetical protein